MNFIKRMFGGIEVLETNILQSDVDVPMNFIIPPPSIPQPVNRTGIFTSDPHGTYIIDHRMDIPRRDRPRPDRPRDTNEWTTYGGLPTHPNMEQFNVISEHVKGLMDIVAELKADNQYLKDMFEVKFDNKDKL